MRSWLVTCGTLVIAAMLTGAVAAVLLGPRLYRWGQEQWTLELERHRLIAGWRPPAADADPAVVFPPDLAGFRRDAVGLASEVPSLRLTGARVLHASYRSATTSCELFLLPTGPTGNRQLSKHLDRLYRDPGNHGPKQRTGLGYRFYLSSRTYGQNHVWLNRGWLAVLHHACEDDLEPVLAEFVRGAQAAGPTEGPNGLASDPADGDFHLATEASDDAANPTGVTEADDDHDDPTGGPPPPLHLEGGPAGASRVSTGAHEQGGGDPSQPDLIAGSATDSAFVIPPDPTD